MAIITVSRELAALGDETAREAAKLLNYRFVDKSIIEERMNFFGAESSKFQKFDEKKPSLLASLSKDRDDYLHFLKSAILYEANLGAAVFAGRGAGFFLGDVPLSFSIFLTAPMEIRLERVKSYFHCDNKKARQILERSDQERGGFYRYFFDADWKEPGIYHLVLNTGLLPPSLCADMIKNMLDRTITEDSEALAQAKISELTLGQKIRHHILYQKELQVHFLDVVVSENMVTLFGVAGSFSVVEAVSSSAGEIAGGYTILSKIKIAQDYNVMP